MSEFPKNIDIVLNKIAVEYQIAMYVDSYHNAINREYCWFEGKNIRKRIDFNCNCESKLRITFYKDIYPFCSKLLIWCYRNIPMFPYSAKIEWESLDELPTDKSDDFYVQKVKGYISYAKKK